MLYIPRSPHYTSSNNFTIPNPGVYALCDLEARVLLAPLLSFPFLSFLTSEPSIHLQVLGTCPSIPSFPPSLPSPPLYVSFDLSPPPSVDLMYAMPCRLHCHKYTTSLTFWLSTLPSMQACRPGPSSTGMPQGCHQSKTIISPLRAAISTGGCGGLAAVELCVHARTPPSASSGPQQPTETAHWSVSGNEWRGSSSSSSRSGLFVLLVEAGGGREEKRRRQTMNERERLSGLKQVSFCINHLAFSFIKTM
ncbi:hypothetical protein BKA64DRAFT_45605 [Cadophora sp. MPI-SDFR-AT-0126]|nr:hypothetical protein BKA64DRAFT_45605 [Leotiomycetes sp. MPI-SDFR-AT-0126]